MDTMNMKDFYSKALLLEDNQIIIIKYELNKHNIGKIQLSNSVKLLTKQCIRDLQRVLKFIEPFATEYFYAYVHDTN